MISQFPPVDVSARAGRLMLLSTDMGLGGGAEEQVILIAYALKARGWKILIVSMLPPSPMPPDFADSGIELQHLGMTRGLPNPLAVFRLARLIREFRPDVVHAHMPHANLLGRIVRLVQPYPVMISTLQAETMAGVEHDRGWILEIAHRWTDWLCDKTTAICRSAAEYAITHKAVPSSKMLVVYNAIQCERYLRQPVVRERMRKELDAEEKFVWLAAARLEASKAYPTMLRAFARLEQRNRVLLICGQGTQAERLKALSHELGLGERVRFLGLRSDMPAVMSAADAFVLSSDTEGLSLSLLQASAASLPIVATDVAGNSDIVIEGRNGFLTPAGDPSAFAAALARVESLPPPDRAEMGAAGLARVRELFELERITQQWEQVYADALARRQRPRRTGRKTSDMPIAVS